MACEITIYDIQDKIGEEFKNKFKNASVKGGDIFIPLNYQNETTLYGEINSLVKELNDSYTIGRFKDFISFYKANEFGYRVEVRPTEALAEAMTEQEISDELGYDFYMGDFALREQEERDLLFSVRKVPETNQDRIEQPNFTKEGVEELFESNPELANQVYEAVGTTQYQLPQGREIEEFVASEKTIRDLAARMSDRIGIPVRFESDRTREYKGKLEDGTAVVNLAYATLDTPIHEILGHPIIRAIKNRDKILSYNEWVEINTAPEMQGLDIDISREAYDKYVNWRNNTSKLYQNLLKELEYGKGKEVLDRIKRDYRNKFIPKTGLDEGRELLDRAIEQAKAQNKTSINVGDRFIIDNKVYEYRYYEGGYANFLHEIVPYTLEEQQEEAIVELLGLYTAGRLDKVKDGKLISLLKRLLKEMKAFMKQLLGQKEVEITKLPDSMTLGDIADLLAYSNSKLILPGYEVIYTTQDDQQFKTYQEASNHISELARSVEDVDLSKIDISLSNRIKDLGLNYDFSDLDKVESFPDYSMGRTIYKENGNWVFDKEWDTEFYNQNGYFPTQKIDDIDALYLYNESKEYEKALENNPETDFITLPISLEDLKKQSTESFVKQFIEENKEYEQTREIIEEYKKVNDIQYNPEEVYSRGQEFIHIHNAYANGNVETHLWLQNILQIIEDNETVGTSTELSFVTSPKGEIMKGMDTGIRKEAAIYIKAYPQPKDIAFASYIDNFTSSFSRTGDLLKGFSDKKREITGLTFTKSVPMRNLHTVIPNLADAIDNVAHHNEIVIGLTNTNFRLHYGPETDYQSKKLIDRINSILDQKYGKLVEPEIKKQGEKVVQYGLFSKGANDILDWFDTKEEAQAKADESNKQLKDLGETADYSVKPITKPIGVQPTQTNETLKESIEDVKNRLGIAETGSTRSLEAQIKYKKQEIAILDGILNTSKDSTRLKESQQKKEQLLKDIEILQNKIDNPDLQKEYTEQALINAKVAVLKEAAKKYPRSLIRSEVRKISILERETGMRYEDTLFEEGDLPFQKLSSNSERQGQRSDSPDQLFSGRRAPIDINNIDTTEEALLVIENIMKNQESVLGRTKDDRYYIINNKKYARVSDTLPNDFDGDTSLYENSRVAGNTVDTIVRDFFSGDLKSNYIGISNEAQDSLLKRLESIKEKIDSRGEVFLTNNIVLFNDELGVAGEVDILSVDKDGNFHLYDVKTTKKGSLKWYDTSYKGKMTKRNRHSLQLSAYNNLFEYQYGKKFKRMGIIPFELVYDEAGHIHDLNEVDYIPHTYNTAVEQYIPKKNQQKTEEEDFQERAYRKQQQEEQEYDPNEPLGDNYFELVNWKNKELEKIEKEKKRLKTILKYRDTSENRAILKNLEAKQKTIENQLQQLSHKEIDYMFHAILEDLYDLELALKSGSMHDIQNVKEKIDYYREFIKTLPNHPDFKPISEKVVRLEALQSKRNREKLMEELENSDLIKNVLDNLNKDITDPNDKYTIEDLLVANADIPWTDREFLGLISSNTGDTVLPQYLFAKFRTSLMRNTNTATDFVDKLQAYLQKHGAGEREWIYERDSMGGKTGRLIDVFSENWLEEISERNRLLRNYRTSLYETGENISQNYDEIIDWYTSKAVVVDFTRLSAVKDIYGTNPEYAKYFEKSTDEKIARYENNLKKQLGPRFNDVVDQILNKLSKFEELKQDDSIDPIWRNRTIASYNVWEFLDNYKKGLTGPINYKWEKGTSSVYFSPEAFSDLTILPINKISKVYYNNEGLREVEETDSGFYNEEYQKILNDPVKLEYWSIMKDMSEYVRDTYGLRDQGLTYAKIQDAYAERLLQDLDFLKKNPKLKNLKKLFLDGAREYKSFFYEQGTYSTEKGIRSNYSDTSRVEISKLSKTYILQGMKPKEAYKKARREVLENYTPNLNNAMKAAVLEAAVQNARLETESLSEGLLDVFKSIKARDEKGEATVERVNAISRLEAYIDKVILNRSTKYRDSKDLFGRTISDQGWLEKILTELGGDSKVIKQIKEADLTKYLSEADKKILENLRGLKGGNYSGEFKIETTLDGETVTLKRNYDKSQGYFYTLNSKEITKDEFDELFDEYIDKEISNIGLDLNMAGLLDGVLKSVILSGLGLNPISGIFNRIEGKHSAMIMDLTGEYWTTGNIDHANQFLAFSNLIRLSPFKVPRKYKDKQVQIQILQEVLDRFQVLQDRKRENERVMRSNRMDRNLLNIFQFAVDNPEFKNQGAIMLSVMMDTKIFDNNGNEYKFFDPETMTFPAFNFEEGTISIKPEFSDSFSFNTPEMERMVLKIEDAVSHSQGNYNQHDIMKIKRGVWGRALTTFMTWFPEQVNQRWGTRTTGDELNINLFTGKERRDGRYVEAWKTSKPAFLTFVLTSLGISYGMLGMAGIIGTGIIGAIVYQKFLKKVTANTQREVNYIKEMVEFLKSLLIESLNYPSRALNTSDKFRIKNRSFENTTMSEQDIAALRAITRELAIMLSLLSIKLAYGMLRYDDDDDKESSKRMRYNFVQNQLSRGINALSTYTDPHSLVTDHSRIALLSHLENIWKILDGTLFDPNFEKAKEGFLGFSPLPNILTKGTLPWENKMVYDEMTGFTGITPPMKWTQEFIKDFDTGGEYSAKKDYNEARKEIRDKLKKNAIKKYGSNKNVVKAVVDAKMRLEIGSKPSELTYKEAYAKLIKGEKLEPVRRIKRPKPKNVLIQELAERLEKLGIPRTEAKKIAMEELK